MVRARARARITKVPLGPTLGQYYVVLVVNNGVQRFHLVQTNITSSRTTTCKMTTTFSQPVAHNVLHGRLTWQHMSLPPYGTANTCTYMYACTRLACSCVRTTREHQNTNWKWPYPRNLAHSYTHVRMHVCVQDAGMSLVAKELAT